MTDPRETKRTQRDGKPGFTSDLAARIKRAQGEDSPAQAAADRMRQREMTGLGRGFRLGSEFVAAVVVGAALGWGIDRLFGTTPWGMIILLLLGFAAGVLNVVRAAAEMNAEAAKLPMAPSVPDDEDEDK
ncbi:MAG TPA: AtpZ/AtpI family protein [Devosia sp.]|nr:AtpZ/AtpI family protein [Devosia sp.]